MRLSFVVWEFVPILNPYCCGFRRLFVVLGISFNNKILYFDWKKREDLT